MIKKLALLFGFLAPMLLQAQPSSLIRMDIRAQDIFLALQEEKDQLCILINENLKHKKLEAFRDSLLGEKYSYRELDSLTKMEYMIQVRDPNFPDDPYSLIDSVIWTSFTWSPFQSMTVYENSVKFNSTGSFSFFLDRNKLSLLAGKNKLLDFAVKYLNKEIATQQLRNYATYYAQGFPKGLYRFATKTGLKAYRNDSLTSFFNPVELASAGMWFRKTNDSSSGEVMREDSLKQVAVFFFVDVDQRNIQLRIHSFAPLYQPWVGSWKLPMEPLFHANAQSVLNEETGYLWDIILRENLRRSVERYRWRKDEGY